MSLFWGALIGTLAGVCIAAGVLMMWLKFCIDAEERRFHKTVGKWEDKESFHG